MNVVFRADGDNIKGMGHIFRSYALYDFMRIDKSINVEFYTKENEQILKVLSSLNELKFIPKGIKNLDDEIIFLKKESKEKTILICDGYHFTKEYQEKARRNGFKIVLIDDGAEKSVDCDLLINHGHGANECNYFFERKPRFLLGPKYSLVNKIFKPKKNAHHIKKDSLFIAFGGADPKDLSYKFINFLSKSHTKFREVNLVLGAGYTGKLLTPVKKKMELQITIHKNLPITQMRDLMVRNEYFILPCSTIMIEALSLNKSVYGGFYIQNQKGGYDNLIKSDLIFEGGDFNSMDYETFEENLHLYKNSNHSIRVGKVKKVFGSNSLDLIVEEIKKL